MRIRFIIPQVQTQPGGRPTRCPYCGRKGLRRYQPVLKPVKDHRLLKVQAVRYQCKSCKRTFRHYPKGVSKAQQTAATKAMSVLLWVLGLSLDNVSIFLRALGCGIAKSTAWLNLQASGERARELRKRRPKTQVRVLGIDTTGYKVKGKSITTGMITNGEAGEVIEVEILEGEDKEEIEAWLKELVEELEVEVLISDDADAFKGVADDLGLRHQVCVAHVRKWATKRTKGLIKEAQRLLKTRSNPSSNEREVRIRGDPQELIKDCLAIKEIVKELGEEGPKELERLHFKYLWAKPPGKGEKATLWYRMRLLTLRLWEEWKRLIFYKSEEGKALGLDGTNNVTERAIGRCGKIRYKMMRGYKSRESWKLTHELFAWLGREGNGYRLGEVIN